MTTSTLQFQAECSSLPPTSASKRRRRSAATGAAEDCHACRKTQTPCDRRRPYCSQCLDIGKNCSGYRTNLTWGVGVASRGKLRGLSLPIAGASGQKTSRTQNATAKVSAGFSEDMLKCCKRRQDKSWQHQNPEASMLLSHYAHYHSDVLHVKNSGSQLSGSPAGQKTPSINQEEHQVSQSMLPSYASSLTDTLQSSTENTDLLSLSNVTSYNGSTSNECIGLLNPSTKQSGSWSREVDFHVVPSSPLTPPFTGEKSLFEDTLLHHDLSGSGCFNMPLEAGPDSLVPTHSKEKMETIVIEGDYVESTANFNVAPRYEQPLTDLSANIVQPSPNIRGGTFSWTPTLGSSLGYSNTSLRVRSLLDFYEKAICPVLVAFDGASNPYRRYIMPLALQDRGLQSALAALATNNLRMRRLKEVPCLKGAPTSVLMQMANVIGKPTAEEQMFKSKSIEYLNNALARTGAAEEDSVLATLLILCLFHVCDSGFSRFKTQLIGVQKLLRMRRACRHSEFVGWVEMFFAWFDVMTSAINDRETQIHSDSLALVNISHNVGSVEQFSGCEGRLFRLLARLGRLNLLSQGRQVRTPNNAERVRCTFEDLSRTMPDERQEFWHEWYDVREGLFTWALNEASPPEPCSSDLSRSYYDTLHISEAFRYSALLYTERLAYPALPSSSRNLQDFVLASIYHISQIGMRSCVLKFLLWPLFITGTECVLEEHRDLIRALCGEIQKESGFYNNVSSLEVLERFWKGGDIASETRQAFRWRDAMPRVDGEYIVI